MASSVNRASSVGADGFAASFGLQRGIAQLIETRRAAGGRPDRGEE